MICTKIILNKSIERSKGYEDPSNAKLVFWSSWKNSNIVTQLVLMYVNANIIISFINLC